MFNVKDQNVHTTSLKKKSLSLVLVFRLFRRILHILSCITLPDYWVTEMFQSLSLWPIWIFEAKGKRESDTDMQKWKLNPCKKSYKGSWKDLSSSLIHLLHYLCLVKKRVRTNLKKACHAKLIMIMENVLHSSHLFMFWCCMHKKRRRRTGELWHTIKVFACSKRLITIP